MLVGKGGGDMELIVIRYVHLDHTSPCIHLKMSCGGNEELYVCQYCIGVGQNVGKFQSDSAVSAT